MRARSECADAPLHSTAVAAARTTGAPSNPRGTRGPSRRRFLAAGLATSLPWLAACSTPLPLAEPAGRAARNDGETLLRLSAEAHGLEAYRQLRDINVAYDGEWRPLVDRVQPVVVDKAYRRRSEERLIPALGLVAQSYTGSAGVKQVVWRRGASAEAGTRELAADKAGVAVWLNGQPNADPEALDAAALVADGYGLFLLGPLWLMSRGHSSERSGTERVDGRSCEVVDVWLRPGLGRTALDRLSLCIDSTGLMRRVRFTLEGFSGTRGAVAQVDTYEHVRRAGVMWPMRSYEEVVHPLRLPAHDWHVTGLDMNRGYGAEALSGPAFSGAAARPAAPI